MFMTRNMSHGRLWRRGAFAILACTGTRRQVVEVEKEGNCKVEEETSRFNILNFLDAGTTTAV